MKDLKSQIQKLKFLSAATLGPCNRRNWRLLVLLLVLDSALCFAQSTNQTKRLDYADFRLVTERNIFNPRRYARSGARPQQAARYDAFTLVGTMAYEKGPFAFFEGTSADYKKVLKVADSIAGYKVTNITYNSVNLVGQTNEVQLGVGMQMRREESGPWHLATASETASAPPSETAGNTRRSVGSDSSAGSPEPAANGGNDTASTPAASGGADDPVLKRLMQRREQEMNR